MKTHTLIALAAFATVASVAHAESTTYQIDPNHTSVVFEANHFNTSTLRGRFDKKDGSVVIDRQAKTGKADIKIDATSIDTGVGALDGHLKSKDFFNAAESPSVQFVGDQFSFDGDKVAAVSGQLTLLGKTLPVTLKASRFNCYTNPLLKREVCGGDFETTIARSQWGMNYGLNFGLPDNIHLLIQIEAIKQ
jgi:polyisoprenoid-binding protein YceI